MEPEIGKGWRLLKIGEMIHSEDYIRLARLSPILGKNVRRWHKIQDSFPAWYGHKLAVDLDIARKE